MANRIRGITVEIGGDTTKLEDSLKQVNKTISTTQSELRDVEKLLKLDPTNIELLSQKQKALKESISATKEKLDTLRTAQEQAKAQLENGTLGADKYDALQREIIATEQELTRLTAQAAESNAALVNLSAVGDKLQSIGSSISDVGSKLTTGITVPLLAIGTAAVNVTKEFDSAMSQVSAISSAVGEDFTALRDKAREVGERTKYSASEAAEAMSYMSMA